MVFVRAIAAEHGRFGRFLVAWPPSDEVGLLAILAERGGRLGGNSGQMPQRRLGFDGFVLSGAVVASLRDAGLDMAPEPKSKRDPALIQEAFDRCAEETGLPYVHLSRIRALSIGETRTPHDETARD